MTKTIEDLFFYAVFAADFFVIVQILFFYKQSITHKVLGLLFFYCLFNSLSNVIPSYISSKALYYSLALFTSVEYLVFALIFSLIIKNKKFKRLILYLSLFFIGFVIFNFHPERKSFDSLPIGVETILIMVYCFYYLYEQMNDLSTSFIYHRYHFWIAIGILIYLGGSFFIYIFADKVDNSILDDYWFLTYAFYIVKNIFFLIGIGHLISQSKQSTLSRVKPYTN
ncbi:MAG: hypothetical protein H0U27_06760 [Nitrosopumilus sp.]|nr:hypothetical protein [Nitrosopumilus sp.]